jgi:UDPglucose--hexose-1-phosphate uridylyltransferase
MVTRKIEELLYYGIKNKMMSEYDVPLVRNQLLSLMKESEPMAASNNGEIGLLLSREDFNEINLESPYPILEVLINGAVAKGLIEDNTVERDLFDAKIMGCLMPRQGELAKTFYELISNENEKAATDYFYHLSKASNYIRMDRIEKNMNWEVNTAYGNLMITINLSKPEKDPKAIAKARLLKASSYPKCLLCLENVGYEGRLNHPGRSNHRVIPLTLDQEPWYLQYSPYVYYNEHCIVFKGQHSPMSISENTFVRLLDFLDILPHYFLGSNADLPIVGGSILSHDHFQGGHYEFPMAVGKIIMKATCPQHPEVNIGIVKWPLSVIRLSSANKASLIHLGTMILNKWRDYTDEANDIYAYSITENGEKEPHNTITPIARKNKSGDYELDLVLRNNRQSAEHPEGIFHPHRYLHHIKKENIGLIEVMGLAVLPPRLKTELKVVESVLTGYQTLESVADEINDHLPWVKALINKGGIRMKEGEARSLIENEVGNKFVQVLECAGVYKDNEAGRAGFIRFFESMGFNR